MVNIVVTNLIFRQEHLLQGGFREDKSQEVKEGVSILFELASLFKALHKLRLNFLKLLVSVFDRFNELLSVHLCVVRSVFALLCHT